MLVTAGPAHALQPVKVTTPRGATIEILAERPPGKGPFPVLVLGSGSGYHMQLPILERTARAFVQSGVGVYRFNWAYYVRDPAQGKQSTDRSDEIEDMRAVLALARAEPWVDETRVFVGGKSLGSIIVWRVFRADSSLAGAILLTPVCTRSTQPPLVPEQNYPELLDESRPTQWIFGDQDAVCEPKALFRFLSTAPRAHRIALLSGNHSFERGGKPEMTPSSTTKRTIQLAAELAADFVATAQKDLAIP